MFTWAEANDTANHYWVFAFVFMISFYICQRLVLKSFQEYLDYKVISDANERYEIRLENIKIENEANELNESRYETE